MLSITTVVCGIILDKKKEMSGQEKKKSAILIEPMSDPMLKINEARKEERAQKMKEVSQKQMATTDF